MTLHIVKIDVLDVKDMLGMHAEVIAEADVVIGPDNMILRDKRGGTGRDAHPDEVAAARKLVRWE